MSRIVLSRQVCDSLAQAQEEYTNGMIMRLNVTKGWERWPVLNDVPIESLMQALVNGYEYPQTPEDMLYDLYYDPAVPGGLHATHAYRKAMKETLNILKIHYDWIDDAP